MGAEEAEEFAANGLGKPRAAAHEDATSRPANASVYCPVCFRKLEQHRCKLVCKGCGYYMSCSDYY